MFHVCPHKQRDAKKPQQERNSVYSNKPAALYNEPKEPPGKFKRRVYVPQKLVVQVNLSDTSHSAAV